MAKKAQGWTCRKASCKFKNPPRTRKCQQCGKARPVKKGPAHAQVLKQLTYEDFLKLNDGVEACAICGRLPSLRRRLDRDHSHIEGYARGLLCHTCNRRLRYDITVKWLRSAADYLDRAAARYQAERSSE